MNKPSKELQKSKDVFKNHLRSMIDAFVAKNSAVKVGERVIGKGFNAGQEFEITSIKFSMSITGSMGDFLPILNYCGKLVSKKGIVMKNRKEVFLYDFIKPDGKKYVREHVYFEPKDICRYMYN